MRIALGIEYNGNELSGWQAQENLPTVQGYLEKAISSVANESIQIFCAGRTDAGVHATGQVIHFDTDAVREVKSWILGTNTLLPSAVSVKWANEVDENFHARFSALSRRYRYVIYNHSSRSAFHAIHTTWYHHFLDAQIMHDAAQRFLGERDFTSFRSSKCEANTPMRNVMAVRVHRKDNLVIVDIEANAFLHHMVRNIVGVLLKVGTGQRPVEWVTDVLEAKDRCKADVTAPPTGLFLVNVQYPDLYQFPVAVLPFS